MAQPGIYAPLNLGLVLRPALNWFLIRFSRNSQPCFVKIPRFIEDFLNGLLTGQELFPGSFDEPAQEPRARFGSLQFLTNISSILDILDIEIVIAGLARDVKPHVWLHDNVGNGKVRNPWF